MPFKVQFFLFALLAMVFSGLCWLASVYFSPLSQVENWLLDMRVAVLSPIRAEAGNVVIVGITEETLSTLTYRQPIDRAFLADLLERIDRAGASVIALDVLLDQATEPEKDQRLKDLLRELETPVFAAYVPPGDSLTESQQRFLDDFVPVGKRALVNLRRDAADGVVRSVLAEGRSGVPGLANAMAYSSDQIEILSLQRNSQGTSSAFTFYPAHIVSKLPDSWFAGKHVLIGADLPLQDRHPTSFQALLGPQEGARPGVEIHAHALVNLMGQSDYKRLGAMGHLPAMFALALLALLIGRSDWHGAVKALSLLMLISVYWAFGLVLMQHFNMVSLVMTPLLCTLLALSAGVALASREHRSQKIFIRKAMSHYVAPEIVADLQRNPEKLKLGGERRVLSILFTDIAGFTGLSERVEATLLLDKLNLYLHGMGEIINRHAGIVDKYIGDAVVGLFNAPLDVPDHARLAVKCAIELDAFAQHFMQAANAQGLQWGETRIGVHTGEVIVGNMGGEKRFDYTAVGDAMNTAARLEGLNKYLPTRMCVSEQTVQLLETESFEAMLCEVAQVVLKGKESTIRVFTPFACSTDEARASVAHYQAAMKTLNSGQMEKALNEFKSIQTDQTELSRLVLFQQSRLVAGSAGQPFVLEDK